MVNKRPTQLGKILVVDDEEIMRRSLADILRQEGYQVHMVASGEAAVNTLRTMQASGDSFDVILLDLKMPGMDGLDVLRVASNLAPDTLVILLAEQGSWSLRVECHSLQGARLST